MPVPAPRRSRPVLVAGAVLAVLAVGAAIAVTEVDADVLRTRVEAAVGRETGRALTIAGPVHLSLLPAPGIVATDVTLANLPGGSRPVMAHADRVKATIDPWALLGGHIGIRSVSLTNADILLEREADGRANWVFSRRTPDGSAHGTPGDAGTPHHEDVELGIGNLDIDGGTITWRDPGRLGDGAFTIRHLDAQQASPTSSFTLALEAEHGTTPFFVSLASSPPQSLRHTDAAHPFALRAMLALHGHDETAPDTIRIDGRLSDPLEGRGFAGVVHAHLRQLTDLDALFPHAGLPQVSELHLETRLAQAPTGGWTVSGLDASTGAADATRLLPGLALAHLTTKAATPDAALSLEAAGTLRGQPFTIAAPALGTLASWAPAGSGGAASPLDVTASLGAAHAHLSGTLAHAAGNALHLAAATELSVPDPHAVAAAFGARLDRHVAVAASGRLTADHGADGAIGARFAADRLAFGGAPMPPTTITLDRAPTAALRATFATTGGAPWLTWSEDPGRGGPATFSAVLDAHRLPAAPVLALAGAPGGVSGALDAAGQLSGTTEAGRIDPASLRGTVDATLVDGAVAGALVAPVLQATHLPIGGALQHVRCAGVAGTVADGLVRLSSLSLDSRVLALDGAGTVTLPAGALALQLHPQLRLGGTAATAPVTIGGTLAAPVASLGHDSQGRFALNIGGARPTSVACDANPDVAALPAAKAPRPIDILRGLFR